MNAMLVIRQRLEALLRLRAMRVEQALKLVQARRAAFARAEQAWAAERGRLVSLKAERSSQQSQLGGTVAGTIELLASCAERVLLIDERITQQTQAIDKARQLRDAAERELELARAALRRTQNRVRALQEQLHRKLEEEARTRQRAIDESAEELVMGRAARLLVRSR